MCARARARVCWCLSECEYMCLCVCVSACLYVCVSVCVCVLGFVRVCFHVCMCACVRACVWVCLCVRVRVCVCVCVCVCLLPGLFSFSARSAALLRRSAPIAPCGCVGRPAPSTRRYYGVLWGTTRFCGVLGGRYHRRHGLLYGTVGNCGVLTGVSCGGRSACSRRRRCESCASTARRYRIIGIGRMNTRNTEGAPNNRDMRYEYWSVRCGFTGAAGARRGCRGRGVYHNRNKGCEKTQ
jgi:hypothetical protein